MPDGPWRCSECGTVNEPVATSCRTCGRWPSLFDLEASVVGDAEREDARAPAPAAAFPADATSVEPAPFEPETFEHEPFEAPPLETEPYEDEGAEEDETESRSRGRRLARFIVPIAFMIYLVISIVFGDR